MLKFETFPVDILDKGDRYIVLVDIPGVPPQDLEIFGEEYSITIKGIKKAVKDGTFITMERFSGKFSRKIHFPQGINISKATAKIENGVLFLEIPKLRDEIFIDASVKIRIFF